MIEAGFGLVGLFLVLLQYEQRRIWRRLEQCEDDRLRLHEDIRRLLKRAEDNSDRIEGKKDR